MKHKTNKKEFKDDIGFLKNTILKSTNVEAKNENFYCFNRGKQYRYTFEYNGFLFGIQYHAYKKNSRYFLFIEHLENIDKFKPGYCFFDYGTSNLFKLGYKLYDFINDITNHKYGLYEMGSTYYEYKDVPSEIWAKKKYNIVRKRKNKISNIKHNIYLEFVEKLKKLKLNNKFIIERKGFFNDFFTYKLNIVFYNYFDRNDVLMINKLIEDFYYKKHKNPYTGYNLYVEEPTINYYIDSLGKDED